MFRPDSIFPSFFRGTDKAGAFILLHEFGHIMNATGFKSDNGNVEAGKSNNDVIHNNCQETLRKI